MMPTPELNLTNLVAGFLILILCCLPVVILVTALSIVRSLRRIATVLARYAPPSGAQGPCPASSPTAATPTQERPVANSAFGR